MGPSEPFGDSFGWQNYRHILDFHTKHIHELQEMVQSPPMAFGNLLFRALAICEGSRDI